MLHPNQFEVNEAWIAFKLNDEPIQTEQDGDFDFLALMDAASCFVLGFASVPVEHVEPSQLESKRLLKDGQAHKKRWPKTLFVPTEQPAQFLVAEAERLGIDVVRVTEERLSVFIDDVRDSFWEHLGARGTH